MASYQSGSAGTRRGHRESSTAKSCSLWGWMQPSTEALSHRNQCYQCLFFTHTGKTGANRMSTSCFFSLAEGQMRYFSLAKWNGFRAIKDQSISSKIQNVNDQELELHCLDNTAPLCMNTYITRVSIQFIENPSCSVCKWTFSHWWFTKMYFYFCFTGGTIYGSHFVFTNKCYQSAPHIHS